MDKQYINNPYAPKLDFALCAKTKTFKALTTSERLKGQRKSILPQLVKLAYFSSSQHYST